MASEFRSCRRARSPIRRVTGLPEARAKPAAVATVPSIPLAPRLAATGFLEAYRTACGSSTPALIEVRTDREENKELHGRLLSEISEESG